MPDNAADTPPEIADRGRYTDTPEGAHYLAQVPPELAERGRELLDWLHEAGWCAHPDYEWRDLASDQHALRNLRARLTDEWGVDMSPCLGDPILSTHPARAEAEQAARDEGGKVVHRHVTAWQADGVDRSEGGKAATDA